MKFYELVEATIIQDIKKSIKDSLVALKIQGIDQVETNQVLKDFAKRGMPISYPELAKYIGNDPMIKNINKMYITFNQQDDNIDISSKDKVDQDKATVQKMANKQLDKELS